MVRSSNGNKYRRALVQAGLGVIDASSVAVFCARTAADILSNASSTPKGCACFGRFHGRGVGEGDGQEKNSGVHPLQTVLGLSPVGGKRGKSRGFAQMYVLRLSYVGGCPPTAGGRENAGFTPKFVFTVRFPPAKTRLPAVKSALPQPSIPRLKTAKREVCPIHLAGILNRFLGKR
jgi:hypothetical protein